MRHDIRAHFFMRFFSPKYYNFRLKLYECFDILIDVLSFVLSYYTSYVRVYDLKLQSAGIYCIIVIKGWISKTQK